jgi:hypothetical protein
VRWLGKQRLSLLRAALHSQLQACSSSQRHWASQALAAGKSAYQQHKSLARKQ